MFIAIPKYLKANVVDVSPSSSRLQAVFLKTGYRNMLILNTYFPQDPKTDDFDTDDLLITLIGIQNIFKENDCTDVIWTGDINADFSRNTKYVSIIRNFVNEQNLDLGINSMLITHMNLMFGIQHIRQQLAISFGIIV